MSNILIDNIFLADRKRTRQDWTDGIAELMQRIRAMDTNDLNEWITWFSNVIRKLNEDERGELKTQIKKGDEKDMCSLFERLLNKEKAEGRAEGWKDGRTEGKVEAVIELLEDLGEHSDLLRNCIMEQMDLELQKKWLKAAARAKSICKLYCLAVFCGERLILYDPFCRNTARFSRAPAPHCMHCDPCKLIAVLKVNMYCTARLRKAVPAGRFYGIGEIKIISCFIG